MLTKKNGHIREAAKMCALYPVDEVKKLYEVQVMYAQALNYIEFLEQENNQLKAEISTLRSNPLSHPLSGGKPI